MKLKFSILLFCMLLLSSCRENIVEFPQPSQTGKVYINSSPEGAGIYWENSQTGKVTPDSLIDVQPGSYTVRLKLLGYEDQIVPVLVTPGQKKYINVRFLEY